MSCSGWMDGLKDSKLHIDRGSDNADPSPRRRASKTAEYFAKIATGDYYCIVCKDRTPSREVILKREKNGSTSRLWRHLKKAHPAIHRRIRHDVGQPSVADVFTNAAIPKQDFTSKVEKGPVEELLFFIFRTKASFNIAESPELERLVSYFAQRDVSLPSAETIRLAAFKKFEEGKASLRQLLGPVRKVSLTMDAWSTENQNHMLMITAHWIDDTWALCERVLGVEEMVGPHSGDNMAEVLIRILKDFSLMDKVCTITLNNPNNDIMISSLAVALKDSELRFNKQYHMPGLVQIVNKVVEEGFKQLGILTTPSMAKLIDELAEDTSNPAHPSKESMDIISSTPISKKNIGSTLGTLIDRLRRTIIASQESPESKALFKDLCVELGMLDKKKLVLDIVTGWNSTYEMLVASLEKRQVLDKMASNIINGKKNNFLISADEWELLKLFASVLSPFYDCIELLSWSKTVFASTALRILEALLSMVVSYINDLDKLPSSALVSSWSAEQLGILKATYMDMKEKLVKYDNSLKKSFTFAIAAVLDPQMKLRYTPFIEQDFIHENLLRLLKEVEDETTSNENAVAQETSLDSIIQSWRKGTLPKGYNLIEAAIKSLQPKARKDEMSVREELDEYFGGACIGSDPLNWWRDVGCLQFPRLAVLAKEFLSICAASTSFERIFAAGQRIVPYKRGSLNSESAAVLMTLKCWAWEENPEDHVEEDEQSDDGLDEEHRV